MKYAKYLNSDDLFHVHLKIFVTAEVTKSLKNAEFNTYSSFRNLMNLFLSGVSASNDNQKIMKIEHHLEYKLLRNQDNFLNLHLIYAKLFTNIHLIILLRFKIFRGQTGFYK